MTTGTAVLSSIVAILLKGGLVALMWISADYFANVPWWLKLIITIVLAADIIKDIVLATAVADSNKKATGKWQWHDRKRTFLGLPLSFTRYRLSTDKLIVSTGFFNTKEEETKLYRITDLSIARSFGQKLFGLGTVTIHGSDKTDSVLFLKNIKRSAQIKELISKLVEAERDRRRVASRELIDAHVHDDDCDAGFNDDYMDRI